MLRDKKQFKDACDRCGKMDYCRGFNGEVLCEKCIQKEMDKKNQEKKEYKNVRKEKKNLS